VHFFAPTRAYRPSHVERRLWFGTIWGETREWRPMPVEPVDFDAVDLNVVRSMSSNRSMTTTPCRAPGAATGRYDRFCW